MTACRRIRACQLPSRVFTSIAATVGFISFFFFWLSIVWGLILRNGWASTRLRHATAYGIHQTVALLGLCLAAVHAMAQLAAPLGPVRLVDEFLPFLNPVDPVGIGVGVVGLEVLTAAALSILIQRRLGYSRWRALHSMTYVAFMLVVGPRADLRLGHRSDLGLGLGHGAPGWPQWCSG